jgi:hypothetical protein
MVVRERSYAKEGQALRTGNNQIRCAGIDGNVAIGHAPERRAWGARNAMSALYPRLDMMDFLIILPKVPVAVADGTNRVRINVDCVGAGVAVIASESTRGIPPVMKEGLVVPGFIKGSLSPLLANLPAKERVGVHVRGAATVLLGVVLVKRHAHVQPLVYGDEESIHLFISNVRQRHTEFWSLELT